MLERIAEWARAKGLDVARLISADGIGTDWEGSTEGGFYETFAVVIRYESADGLIRGERIAGEDMESLWRFVVAG